MSANDPTSERVFARILEMVEDLDEGDKARLAGAVLNAVGVDRDTFRSFWSELDDAERAELESRIETLDVDEEEEDDDDF